MNTKNKITSLMCGVTLAFSIANAATIYDHTFDGGTGDLVGTAEDFSSTLWSNSAGLSTLTADGTSTAGGTGVWLPVTIDTGKVYTLTLGSMVGNNWTAAGFAELNGNTAFNQTGANGYASLLVNGQTSSGWLGVRTANNVYNNTNLNTALSTGTGNTDWDMQITLDTTTTLWSVDYSARVAGDTGAFTSVGSDTFTANPTINYVGISANATGDFDTFTLTVIPEPSSLALIGLAGLAGMMFLRRRRN